MGDWDLLYIVTSAHWLPVTRSGAVISPKTGTFFFCFTNLHEISLLFFSLACVSFLFSSFTTHRWAIYNHCFTDLTLNYCTFSPLLFSPMTTFILYIPSGFAGPYLCLCAFPPLPVHGLPVWIYLSLLPPPVQACLSSSLYSLSPLLSFSQTHTHVVTQIHPPPQFPLSLLLQS